MIDPTTTRPMEWWTVVTEDGQTVEVEYNGNGGFGPVSVWTGTAYLAPVKYRKRRETMSDPNALLKRILELCQDHSDYGFLCSDEADELAESVKEMHRWIMSGGFLPSIWSDKITARPSLIQSDDPWQSPATALTGEEPF